LWGYSTSCSFKLDLAWLIVGCRLVLCSVCGRRPATRRLKVSEKFTAYPDLYAGLNACNLCATLIEDRRYRASHWVLVGDDVRLLGSREELFKVLQDVPVDSLIYVRSSGRRHGFVRCLRFRSSKQVVALCGEDEGLQLVSRSRLSELVGLAVKAYGVLKRKSSLLEGCSTLEWQYEDICRMIEGVRGDPVWRIVVRAL
jgi:hypothetical protein